MAYALADLDAIDQAIATGAQRVRYADGREVFFRSLVELYATKTRIARELGLTPPPRVIIAEHRR